MSAVVSSQLVARQVVRQQGRHLLRHPGDANAHMARLHAALELAGGEPAQGALADLFSCFGAQHETLKRTALQLARPRLSAHAARWFDAQAAQAALKEAEQLYARQSTLAGQQLIARASLDAQRATRDAARAQVAQIRANLSDRVIRAPFAGVLGIRQVSPGALVTPGTEIATLDDIARVFVDFPVPETDLAGVSLAWVGKTAPPRPTTPACCRRSRTSSGFRDL